MNLDDILGMELDIVVEHLKPSGIVLKVQYTTPPHSNINRYTARVVRVNTVDKKVILTVTYETSRKGGVEYGIPNH